MTSALGFVLGLVGLVLVLVLIAVVWGVFSYNVLVKARNVIQESWRQIDVELNRRYELIPNLVETVRGSAAHESAVLEKVTSLRTSAMALANQFQGAPSEQRAAAESELTNAIRG